MRRWPLNDATVAATVRFCILALFAIVAGVTTALRGSNPQKHMFLEAGAQKFSTRGEFLDPWRCPYDIEVTTNTIRIQSRSKEAAKR